MTKKNPFDKPFFDNARDALVAFDEAADKQIEQYKSTVDGVLLERGLKVWCADCSIDDKPWEICHDKRGLGGWHIKHPSGATRDAMPYTIFFDKYKAIIFRIGKLKQRIKLIVESEVEPVEKEVEQLVQTYINEQDGPIEDL